MKRVIQAGAKAVTSLSVTLGMGVEYAYTMVHGAPAATFPEYVIPPASTHR